MNRGRDKFKKYKYIIERLVKALGFIPYKLRMKIFEHVRMIKGIKGIGIRYILLKSLAESCGDNVSVHTNVYIFEPQKLSIGNNVSIHPMSYIDASGNIDIGNDVSLAHGVTVMSSTHRYYDKNVPIKDQSIECKKTIISSNVWIGAKSTILHGNIIGEGSIIGANSVVTKDIEPNSICVGIPAVIIKKR